AAGRALRVGDSSCTETPPEEGCDQRLVVPAPVGLGDEPASPVQIGHQADPGVQRPVSYRAESRSPHAWWGESSGPPAQAEPRVEPERSEERRVGKECRSRWKP